MICLDIAVGQPDVFGQGNDFDQMLKFLTLLTVGVQLILDSLEESWLHWFSESWTGISRKVFAV